MAKTHHHTRTLSTSIISCWVFPCQTCIVQTFFLLLTTYMSITGQWQFHTCNATTSLVEAREQNHLLEWMWRVSSHVEPTNNWHFNVFWCETSWLFSTGYYWSMPLTFISHFQPTMKACWCHAW
jgi:hypothetical protein